MSERVERGVRAEGEREGESGLSERERGVRKVRKSERERDGRYRREGWEKEWFGWSVVKKRVD